MRATDLLLRASRIYYGWLIVAITFAAAALTIGSSNYAFGLFVEPLERNFGWERISISASLSFMAVGSIAAPFLGRLMDRYGARPMMVGALAIFGLSFVLRPLMSQLWHWYALSFLQFVIFSGATSLPAGRLVGIWFRESRGRVMGITLMGNNFGGFTVPIIVGFVITAANWQAGFVVIGVIAFVFAFLALMIVHEHPVRIVKNPGGAGTTGVRADTTADATLQGWTVGQALRTRVFYAMTLAVMLGSFTYTTLLAHVSAHLNAEGMSENIVPLALSLLAAFGMGGKLVFGYLAERITARRALMASLSGQIVFILLIVWYPESPLVWVWVPLFGLHMGAFGALVPLLTQENFGLRYFGSISGLSSMLTVVPYALGPLLAGASFDREGSYGPAFILVAVLFGIAVIALTQARQTRYQE